MSLRNGWGGRWFLAEDFPGGRQYSVHNFASAVEALRFGKSQGWSPGLEIGGRSVSELEQRLLVPLAAVVAPRRLADLARDARTSVVAAKKFFDGRAELAIFAAGKGKRPGGVMVSPSPSALAMAAALAEASPA